MSSTLSLWSCAAHCQDLSIREVIGFYHEDRCLLISRPWIAPLNIPVLQIGLRNEYSLFTSLISVADYHCFKDVWFGEIATKWLALAALSGVSRNTLLRHLRALVHHGLIHYDPAAGATRPALIRIYPANLLTSDLIFQVRPEWLQQFIVKIEPKVRLYEAQTSARNPEFKRLIEERPISEIAATIGNAPIFVPSSETLRSQVGSGDSMSAGNLEIINGIKNVPGLEDEYRISMGLGPDLGPSNPGVQEKPRDPSWERSWSQNGTRVEIKPETPLPGPGQIGWLPTWEQGCIQTTALIGPENSEDNNVCRSAPNMGASRAISPSASPAPAPPAPPPGPPPAANALFHRPRSERQLQPGQVNEIYRQRGDRVSDQARRAMTSKQVSCIEVYERLAGIPFCVKDLPHLDRALAMTSHTLVLRATRDCALKYPPTDPGFYIVRDGMKHILSNIEKNRKLHAKIRGPKEARIKSGTTPAIAEKIKAKAKDRARKQIAAEKAVQTTPATPPPPAPIALAKVSPQPDKTNPKTETKKSPVWPT